MVLDDAVEEKAGGEKVRLGMVVIRGNSVVMLEVWLPKWQYRRIWPCGRFYTSD